MTDREALEAAVVNVRFEDELGASAVAILDVEVWNTFLLKATRAIEAAAPLVAPAPPTREQIEALRMVPRTCYGLTSKEVYVMAIDDVLALYRAALTQEGRTAADDLCDDPNCRIQTIHSPHTQEGR